MHGRTVIYGLIALLSLAGCAGGGLKFGDDQGTAGSNVLRAAEIKTILGGKTWTYKSPTRSGSITFADDGTSLYEDSSQGSGTAKWWANDGQLCQSFGAGGQPDCSPFAKSGDGYKAGDSLLTELKA
jgi:hypothetical protein